MRISELCQLIRHHILHRRLKIKYIHEMTDECIQDVIRFTNLPYPGKAKFLKQLKFLGYNYKNEIYIKRGLRKRKMLAVIAHEFVHYLRKSSCNYDTPAKIFKEEFAAEVVYFFVMGKKDMTGIADYVKRIYR